MGLDLKHSLIDRLRLASLLDGISYIILLGIAMPLKYLADMPLAVRIVGSAHGFLWVALCLFLLLALVKKKLSFGWCVIVFVGAKIRFVLKFLLRRGGGRVVQGIIMTMLMMIAMLQK